MDRASGGAGVAPRAGTIVARKAAQRKRQRTLAGAQGRREDLCRRSAPLTPNEGQRPIDEDMMDRPPVPLAELLRSVDGIWWDERALPVTVHGVVADSRLVRPGNLFVAVRGRERDGHGYIDEALQRGAAAVLASRDVGELTVPVARVEDERRALAELAAQWYGRPADRLRLVGVTGTFGKTTVLAMLEAILNEAGQSAGVIASDAVGVRLNGRMYQENELTTPDAVTLQRLLALMVAQGVELAAIEVTSQALEQRRVHGLSFGLGVFTNIKLLEHMEYHGSFGRYVEAKSTFFDHFRAGAPLIYDADDETLRQLVKGRPPHGRHFHGSTSPNCLSPNLTCGLIIRRFPVETSEKVVWNSLYDRARPI
jgi:UDP-N-acetylmuramyl tripeptide synthase